jgi:hypothetical protein
MISKQLQTALKGVAEIAAKFPFVPDRRELPPEVRSQPDAINLAAAPQSGTIAASVAGARTITLKLREVTIFDHFDGFLFDGFLNPSMEIRLVSVVIDSNQDEPIKFSSPNAYQGIKPLKPLPINSSGLALYFSNPNALPKFLDFRLLVIEDDQDVRNAGEAIAQLRASAEYATILNAAKLAAAATSYAALLPIGDALLGLLGAYMRQDKDDLISYFHATHTLAFDNLGKGTHVFHQDKRSRVKYEILVD